jgi:hypothetical protein
MLAEILTTMQDQARLLEELPAEMVEMADYYFAFARGEAGRGERYRGGPASGHAAVRRVSERDELNFTEGHGLKQRRIIDAARQRLAVRRRGWSRWRGQDHAAAPLKIGLDRHSVVVVDENQIGTARH